MHAFFRHTLLGWAFLALASIPIYRSMVPHGAAWTAGAVLAHLVAAIGWGGRRRSYVQPQSRTSADALASLGLAGSITGSTSTKDAVRGARGRMGRQGALIHAARSFLT